MVSSPHIQAEVLDVSTLVHLLPYPEVSANKYTRGVLTLFAGSAAYPGAACLAAFAAQRMGSGYVRVVCAPETLPIIHGWRPSLVAASWEEGIDQWLPAKKAGHPSACLVGSGFDTRDENQRQLALAVLRRAQAPVVMDGGALSALGTEEGLSLAQARKDAGQTLVITPHGGEAARLLDNLKNTLSEEEFRSISIDPAAQALALARSYGCTIALKGAVTYLSDGCRVACMKRGTAALAKAGTGDVLAGMIAALVSQGMESFDAVCLGTTLHADAGRVASEAKTEIAVVPEDVIDALPEVLRRWEADYHLAQ